MWELTFFEDGRMVGDFDGAAAPEVGTDYGDCRVVEVLAIDHESQTATVVIEYI